MLAWTAATILWFALTLGPELLVLNGRRAAKLLEGQPTVLIENGHNREKALRSSFLRLDKLMTQLRRSSHFNPSTPYEGMAREVIIEGQVIDANLRAMRLNRAWLLTELARRGPRPAAPAPGRR